MTSKKSCLSIIQVHIIIGRKREDSNMRFVIQRVSEASVTVNGQITGKISRGFLVLIGVCDTDTKEIADKIHDTVMQGAGI